jgi:hypothetical protein
MKLLCDNDIFYSQTRQNMNLNFNLLYIPYLAIERFNTQPLIELKNKIEKNIIKELEYTISKILLRGFFYDNRVRGMTDFVNTLSSDTRVYMTIEKYKTVFFKGLETDSVRVIRQAGELLLAMIPKVLEHNSEYHTKIFITFVIEKAEDVILNYNQMYYLLVFAPLENILQSIDANLIRNNQQLLNIMINICKVSNDSSRNPELKQLFDRYLKDIITLRHSYLLPFFESKMESFLNLLYQDNSQEAANLIPEIPKEQVLHFYDIFEPTQAQIDLWGNYWIEQGNALPAPAPARWWLRQQMLNVHSRGNVSVTDCKLKLIKALDIGPYSMEEIAEDIYITTKDIAEQEAIEQKMSETQAKHYIKDNTIDIQSILNCRVDENNPRYYGYGDKWEPSIVIRVPDDERVQLCDILAKIWFFITTKVKNENTKKQLIFQTVITFKTHLSEGPCSQGWVSSLVNIFGSFTKELGFSCLSEEQEQSEDLKNKLLIDSRILDYEGSINKITIEKVYQKFTEPLLDASIEEDDWDEKDHTEEENQKFYENLRLYKTMFDPLYEVSDLERTHTFNTFFKSIFPTYFLLVLIDYFKTPNSPNDRYIMRVVKDAVGLSFEMYKQFRYKSVPKSASESETLPKDFSNMSMRVYIRRKKYKKSRKTVKPYRSSVRKSKFRVKWQFFR